MISRNNTHMQTIRRLHSNRVGIVGKEALGALN